MVLNDVRIRVSKCVKNAPKSTGKSPAASEPHLEEYPMYTFSKDNVREGRESWDGNTHLKLIPKAAQRATV